MEIGFCGMKVIHIVMPSLIRAKQMGRYSVLELFVLIQHIDLKDSHARNAILPCE